MSSGSALVPRTHSASTSKWTRELGHVGANGVAGRWPNRQHRDVISQFLSFICWPPGKSWATYLVEPTIVIMKVLPQFLPSLPASTFQLTRLLSSGFQSIVRIVALTCFEFAGNNCVFLEVCNIFPQSSESPPNSSKIDQAPNKGVKMVMCDPQVLVDLNQPQLATAIWMQAFTQDLPTIIKTIMMYWCTFKKNPMVYKSYINLPVKTA